MAILQLTFPEKNNTNKIQLTFPEKNNTNKKI